MNNPHTFLCPYRKSKGNEAEIMVQSLRSFYQHTHRVVFVGHNPKIPGTECIPYVSGLRTKESRVADQLRTAIEELEMQPFILINDDIFAMAPIDSIPLYYSDTIQNQVKRYHRENLYRKTLENSIQQPDDLNFAVHYPMPVNDPGKFLKALSIVTDIKYCSFRNLYGNMVKSGETIEQTHDCKLFSQGRPEAMQTVLQYSKWLSVGDNWFKGQNKAAVIKHISDNGKN
jgi:hypothetical protein